MGRPRSRAMILASPTAAPPPAATTPSALTLRAAATPASATALGTCTTACACRAAARSPRSPASRCPSRAPLPGVATTSVRAKPRRATSCGTCAIAPAANTRRWGATSWTKEATMGACPWDHLQTRIVRIAMQISAACRSRTAPTADKKSHRRKPRMTANHASPLSARSLIGPLVALACIALAPGAAAQTYGFATLQPGTLNHTTASAVAKVLKEKAGLNVLVQPTAGDQVIVPMVASSEVDVGISNAMEVHDGLTRGFKDLRIIAAAHALRVGFFVRKDSGLKTVADLKGKRVPYGFSAMRALEPTVRAILATAGLTEKEIRPVLVPNVIRSADDFAASAADAFYFAFGAPKVREVDVTVGGIRMTEIDEAGMPAARKIERWGYLTDVNPGPVFVGVEK